MAPTVITVTGTWKDPEGNNATGKVFFTLAAPILDGSGNVMVGRHRRQANLSSGAISIDLYATDEPGTTPTGNTYLVEEVLDGVPKGQQASYSVEIPYDAASSTIDLADIAPVLNTSLSYGVSSVDGESGAVDLSGSYVPAFVVTGYGATGDGATDDTTAVQAAIDAAEANNGGVVYFPPGRYLVTALTVTVKGVALVGASFGDTAGATTYGTVIKISGSGTGITVSAGKCAVRNLRIDGSATAACCLKLAGAAYTVVENVQVLAAATGLIIGGVATSHGCKITRFYADSCTTYGIQCQSSGTDTLFTDVEVNSCAVGVRLDSGAQHFVNLHVFDCTSHGMDVRSDGNKFSNIYMEQNGGSGIAVFNGKYNTFVGGVIRTNTSNGAYTSGTAHRTRFMGLAVYNNGARGIQIASDYNQVIGCNCFDDQGTKTQTYGIYIVSGTSNVVTGCVTQASDHTTGGLSDSGTTTVKANNVT